VPFIFLIKQIISFINQNVSNSISGHTWGVQGTLAPEKQSALKSNNYTGKESSGLANGIQNENLETIAATRIQTAFRAYKVCCRIFFLFFFGDDSFLYSYFESGFLDFMSEDLGLS